MSNALIALLVAIGGGTWVYTKALRRSGNNTQQSVIVAGFVATIFFIIMVTLLSYIN